MIMVEVMSTAPASSISNRRNRPQNELYSCSNTNESRISFQCFSCCAYINWGLKLHTTLARKNLRTSSSVQATNRRFSDSPLFPKSGEIDKSCVNNVARLEFEVVSDERNVKAIVKGNEDFRQILPPWGSVPENDVKDQSSSGNLLTISVGTGNESEEEIYYLEEKDEKILSRRILKLSRANKVRSALALFRSMELSRLVPDSHACNSLLTCLLRKGRLDDAMSVFEFMKSTEIITSHTYSLVLKAVANTWGCDAALRIFEEAQGDDKTKKYMDVIVYNTMIAVSGKIDDWAQAFRLWRIMQDNGQIGTIVTYRLLVCVFVRCGQNELALDAYHEMIQSGLSPTSDVMEAIIGACTREGKWDMALNVMQNMLQDELKPSLVAFNALINTLGKAAKVDLAFKVFHTMKSFGYAPDAYTWNALLGALNRANRHGDTLNLFESIRKEYKSVLNLHTYNTCLSSCGRLGSWEKAMQLLWQMEASGIPASVTSYNLVIGACEAARKPKVALQVYERMVKQNQSPDVFTLLSLVRVCIWGSLWSEVEGILNAAPNGSLYNAAIQGMCLRKETGLAKKLYSKMVKIGLKPDGKTRAFMLQNLPRN